MIGKCSFIEIIVTTIGGGEEIITKTDPTEHYEPE